MVRNIAILRIAIGVISYLAPNLGGKLFGLDPSSNPQAPYLARLFGVRDIALGVGAMQSSGAAQKQLLQLGMACDIADVGAAVFGKRSGYLPAVTALLVGGTAAAAAAMSAAAVSEVDSAPTPSTT
jgi:hypothetical protein